MRGLLAQTAQSLNQEPSCSFAERIQVTIPLGQLNFPSVIASPPRIPDERRQGNFKTSPDPIVFGLDPPGQLATARVTKRREEGPSV